MKNFYFINFITLLCAFGVLLTYSGCKDNPTSPSTSGPPTQGQDSLLFEKDSLSLRTSGSLNWTWPDTINFIQRKLRITFIGEDSGLTFLHLSFWHTEWIRTILSVYPINGSHNYFSDSTCAITLELNLLHQGYIRLKNICIYKSY